MPTGKLPASGKKLWEEVYNKALKGSCKGDKACAAGSAWKAVKGAGWKRDKDGNWSKKAELTEFSLTITKASFDKATQEMRWLASASDTLEDSYKDNMTLELFNDFLFRIDGNELAPEEFRSDFWLGGMPYLSISHYPDLNGDAVPGDVQKVFIDGDYLKAKGIYRATPLGHACFKAICDDLYGNNKNGQDKVRVSIAFLDWAHQHKSNGFLFERKSLDDVCPECLRELITGEFAGKSYKRGQLVHLAHTRVPVNKRTSMEVDKAMTTRKEDATSIVGEELAEELDEKAKLVGKSEALVIKAEDDEEIDEISANESLDANTSIEKAEHEVEDEECDEDDEDCKERMKKKQEEKAKVDKSYVGEVAVVSSPIEYKPFGGATSMKDAQAVIQAQKEQWRISDLWYALQSVIENITSAEDITDKASAIGTAVDEFKDMLADKSASVYNSLVTLSMAKPKDHPLDSAINNFKSDYDAVIQMSDIQPDDKLRLIQESFNAFGNTIVETIKTQTTPIAEQASSTADISADALVKALSEALLPLQQEVSLLNANLQQRGVQPTQEVQRRVPVPRSIAPTLSMQVDAHKSKVAPQNKSETPILRAAIERTT